MTTAPIVIALLALLAPAQASAIQPQCDGHLHLHGAVEHRHLAEKAWADYHVNDRHKRAHEHMRDCARSEVIRKRMGHQWQKAKRAWSERFVWRLHWENEISPGWRSWAYSTGACESGNNASTETGNGYSGAFQFVQSTWDHALGYLPRELPRPYGRPSSYPWEVQAIVSIYLAINEGTGHWPVCGLGGPVWAQ